MVFCFVQKYFFGQHKSQNIYFFVAQSAQFFFQNLTLGYMTKTLNQIIFFSSPKIRIFFSAALGIRIFFLQKNHNYSKQFMSLRDIWQYMNRSVTKKIRPYNIYLVTDRSIYCHMTLSVMNYWLYINLTSGVVVFLFQLSDN